MGDDIDPQAGTARQAPAGAPVLGRRYQYDVAGNLMAIQDSRHGSTQYQYDKIGRILAANQPNLAERFAFDPAHNMLPVATGNPAAPAAGGVGTTALVKDNRLEVFEDKRYSYDTHGNLVEKRIGKHTVIALAWDVEHQLQSAQVTKAAHTAKPVTTNTHYRYDAFGRRLSKQDAFGQTLFEWDSNRLLSEQRGASQTLYVYEPDSFAPLAQVQLHQGLEQKYPLARNQSAPTAIKNIAIEDGDEEDTWRPRQDAAALQAQMLAMQQRLRAAASGAQSPTQLPTGQEPPEPVTNGQTEGANHVVHLADWKVRYYHNDHLGTPRELSDEDGGIAWQASYKAWGNTLTVEYPQTARAADSHVQALAEQEVAEQNLRFQGQYFDAETGLHYNRFRYYDPDVGRFVGQDPIGLVGGINLYSYPIDPISFIDPLGLAWCKKSILGRTVHQRDDLFDDNKKSSWQDPNTKQWKSGTNIDRMADGLAPVGIDGNPITLHHLTQTEVNGMTGTRGSLVELTRTQHQNYTRQLHMPPPPRNPNNKQQTLPRYPSFRKNNDGTSSVQDQEFNDYRSNYWKERSRIKRGCP